MKNNHLASEKYQSGEQSFLKEGVSKKVRRKIEFKKFYKAYIYIFIPCFCYAFFRYTINHGEPIADIPFYLLNKVFGVTSVIMMSLSYVIGPAAKLWEGFKLYLGHRKYFGIGGFFLGAAHGLMSMILMTPYNYKVFYDLETNRLNMAGSLSMFFGTLALVHLFFIAVVSIPFIMNTMYAKQWKNIQRGGMVALVITFLHIASFGYSSWFNLEKWYGGMPPFSLMGASSILLLLGLRLLFVWRWKVVKKKISHNFSHIYH